MGAAVMSNEGDGQGVTGAGEGGSNRWDNTGFQSQRDNGNNGDGVKTLSRQAGNGRNELPMSEMLVCWCGQF